MPVTFQPGEIPDVLMEIALRIKECGGKCYLVGGWVRDSLLGCESKDFDIEVYGIDEKQLVGVLSHYGKPGFVGKAFGVYLISIQKTDYEFAFPRTEKKTGKGHKAFEVYCDPSLDFETASKRRDFTINSMGVLLPELTLVDPNNGQKDLEKRVLRHVSSAFSEDPLRALRAVQFSARFNLSIDHQTKQLCSEQDLHELSTERFFEEFKKLLFKSTHPSKGLHLLKEMQLTRYFPELLLFKSGVETSKGWGTLLKIVDAAAKERVEETKNEEIFMFAALCSQMPEKSVSVFLKRMMRDAKIIRGVSSLTTHCHEVIDGFKKGEREIQGWIRRLSLKVPLRNLNRFALIVNKIEHPEEYLASSQWFESAAKQYSVWDGAPEPLLTGKGLMGLGLSQGPEMGQLIKESFELQVDGKLLSVEKALEWARIKLNE